MAEQEVNLTKETESPDRDSEVTETKIASLAYFFWQSRGCPEGSPEDDWFRAETELRRERQTRAASA